MPVKTIELDGSVREEDVTLLIGKNIVLKLVENRRIEQLLSRPEVKVLLETEDLCHTSLLEKMNSLLRLLDWTNLEESLPHMMIRNLYMHVYFLERRLRFARKVMPALRDLRQVKKDSRKFFDSIRNLDQKIIELENKIREFNSDLAVTRPSIIFSCPQCNAPVIALREKPEERQSIHRLRRPTIFRRFELQLGEFKGSMRCLFCSNSITREAVNRHPVHEIIPTIEEVWKTGLWLEEYTASILRSLEWQTWTRVNILGTSGIPHEVNLLAIKKGFVLVGECKTGKVSREDVFTFSTKMTDLKSHLGLFGLLGELPEPETREFMKKNPAVTLIEKMCDLKRKDLIERFQHAIGRI